MTASEIPAPTFPAPTSAPVPDWADTVTAWAATMDGVPVYTRQVSRTFCDGVELFAHQRFDGETVANDTPYGVALDVDISEPIEGREAIGKFLMSMASAISGVGLALEGSKG